MSASFLSTLRAGPPPPKVALLPDGLFFTRALPVAAGATAAEAAAQVELGLEAISPFPLTQLYYGYYWTPGADRAFVFAAYRRRFTTDQTAAWEGAEIVMPTFAALLGGTVPPATTIVLASPEGLTAVHWAAAGAPAAVLFRPFPPAPIEETEETAAKVAADRARLQEELVRDLGGSKTVIELPAPPAAAPAGSDRETVFRAGDFVSRLPAAVTTALDVRDRGELAAFRGARQRDVILWRVALGCAAGFLLLALGELSLVGGREWQKTRVLKVNGQKSMVEKIITSNDLAKRIDDLTTKRLYPFEMIGAIVGASGELLPQGVQFTRVTTTGLNSIKVELQTSNADLMNIYKAKLDALPVCEHVDVQLQPGAGAISRYTMVVTFKADAIKPAPPV